MPERERTLQDHSIWSLDFEIDGHITNTKAALEPNTIETDRDGRVSGRAVLPVWSTESGTGRDVITFTTLRDVTVDTRESRSYISYPKMRRYGWRLESQRETPGRFHLVSGEVDFCYHFDLRPNYGGLGTAVYVLRGSMPYLQAYRLPPPNPRPR